MSGAPDATAGGAPDAGGATAPEAGVGNESAGAGGASSDPLDLHCSMQLDCPFGADCIDSLCVCPQPMPDPCPAKPHALCVDERRNPEHCGACGHECAAGAGCFEGECQALPTEVALATDCGGELSLAAFGTHLYFTEPTTGRVRTMPLAGGEISDIALNQLKPTAIGVDASGVYWLNNGNGSPGSSAIMKRDFGAPAARALVSGDATPLNALAIANGKLYYALGSRAHQRGTDEAHTDDVVVGMNVVVKETGEAVEESGPIDSLAVNATHIAWANDVDGTVQSHPLALADLAKGSDFRLLGRNYASNPQALAIGGSYAFWNFGVEVMRASLVDAASSWKGVADGWTPDAMTALVLDDSRLYGASADGFILAHSLEPPLDWPRDPEPTWPLTRDQGKITSMVVVGRELYFVNDACAIRKLAL